MSIAMESVHFSYPDGTAVLSDFSLTLPDTGALCLSGPSGCGKTTLLRLLAGLEIPQSGRIVGLEGRRVAFVFQEDRLLPWATARENVSIVLGGKEAGACADEWLRLVGLSGAEDRRPGELSGGMRRRVALARALAYPADLLLLDEPFTGLDKALWRSIAEMMARDNGRRLILLVSHNPEEARRLGAASLPLSGPPLHMNV